MKILGMDSATGACSAALCSDGAVVARRFAAMDRGQSEVMIPMVQAVLDEAGVTFGRLDGLGVTVGPGAFTGLRIGLAAARGIALASGLPLVGVTSFEAVAHGVPSAERSGCPLLVALESRREDVFVQSFDSELNPLDEPRAVRPADLDLPEGPWLVAGDAAARLAAALGARPETLTGLSGLGDLVLTCTSQQSRNFRYGLALGAGRDFGAGTTVEGAATARAVAALAPRLGIELPLSRLVAGLAEGRIAVEHAPDILLNRPLKEE